MLCYVMLCYVMTNRTERTLSVMLVNGEMTVNIVHNSDCDCDELTEVLIEWIVKYIEATE